MPRFAVTANGPSGTDVRLETTGAHAGELALRVNRILRPGDGAGPSRDAGPPCLSATWRSDDGTYVRGVFASARYPLA